MTNMQDEKSLELLSKGGNARRANPKADQPLEGASQWLGKQRPLMTINDRNSPLEMNIPWIFSIRYATLDPLYPLRNLWLPTCQL